MDLSNRDAEHLIGSAWNKENRVPNTVSLPLEITCPAFAGMHSSRPRYEISIVLRNFTQVKMCSHTNCFASTKRTTFQPKQVHIFTWLTQLPLQVNSMCRKCIGKVMEKSRWRTFISYQSHWAPPPTSFSNFFWRRTSKGTWESWESQMVPFWSRFPRELWKWPLPFFAWHCALSPSPPALWLGGEEIVRERAEAGPLFSPDGQEVV